MRNNFRHPCNSLPRRGANRAAQWLGIAATLSACTSVAPPGSPVTPPSPTLGYSAANMDRSVSPRQDFYRFAAGTWLNRTAIPDSEGDIFGARMLNDNLRQQLLALIRDAANSAPGSTTGPRQQIGDFYRAASDDARRDALGLQPLAADFAQIARIDGPAALGRFHARLSLALGGSPLVNLAVGTDRKDSSRMALYVASGALPLRRDEYLEPASAGVRALYQAHVASMLRAAGDAAEQADQQARTVLALETALAGSQLTPLQASDPRLTYNKMSLDQVQALAPGIDLRAWLQGLGVTAPSDLIVLDTGALRGLQDLLATRPAADVRTLLRWFVIGNSAADLGRPFADLDREFARRHEGLAQSPSRERRLTDQVATLFAHPLSQLYVEKHFPERTRRDITEMVDHIRAEFEQRLRSNPWLDEPTRLAALAKLARMDIQVGYPQTWIDYSAVQVRADDHLGNVQRVLTFQQRRDLAALGKPARRDHFAYPGHTTPIDVNAAYQGNANAIEITAAIVQPPFYVPTADAVVNYCTIGAVIGHEMTHGFDSTGRQFDANGNLRDWWTPGASAQFQQRTGVLVQQYSSFEVLPGVKHNGALTVTENTADLGGITLARAALQRQLGGQPAPVVDGLTGDQRCFVAWAQMWMGKARPEKLQKDVQTNPHAMNAARAVQPLLHLDAFHQAFGIRPGDAMWRAPENRVRIW